MEIVFFIVLVVAIAVGGHYLGEKHKRERQQALTEAADGFMLDTAIDPNTASVSGLVDGVEVEYRLVTRGSGSNATSWTECEVAVDTQRLDIALREQTRGEERWVEKGLARDVDVGDDAFDGKYIVEAAPIELARKALDGELRTELLAHHPLEVKACDGGLLFEKRGWLEKPDEIRRFAAMAAQLVKNMNAAIAAAHEEDERDAALAGYRGATPDARREGELRAREETAELKALRVERQKAISQRNWMITLGFVVVIVGVLLAQRC